MSLKYWLMKAEPDSRIEKGKDVKFSVDNFESIKTTPWEGVRNHEAKNLMKSMKIGDRVLFYHSNCKTPGIAAFAEVSREAYPDYTAWDPKHPYYDPKSDEKEPKWFMVDLTFKERAEHFVPLSLMKRVASLPTNEPPDDIAYIGEEGVSAIKGMALVNRGRLSVQIVEENTWTIVELLAERGGWDEITSGKGAKKHSAKAAEKKEKPGKATKVKKTRTTAKTTGGDKEDEDMLHEVQDEAEEEASAHVEKPKKSTKKRKAETMDTEQTEKGRDPPRRSTRARR